MSSVCDGDRCSRSGSDGSARVLVPGVSRAVPEPDLGRTSRRRAAGERTAATIGTVEEQPLDLAPGLPAIRFTPELLREIEAELTEVEASIEALQLDRVVTA